MKYFILFFILISLSIKVHSYSFFSIPIGGLKLNSESFRRYARPQLRSIVNEYFLVLRKVSPQTARIINLRRNSLQVSNQTNQIVKKCNEFSEECKNLFSTLKKSSTRFEKEIYKELESTNISTIQIDDHIEYIRLLKDLATIQASVSHELEEFQILLGTDLERYSKGITEIQKKINQSQFLLNIKINTLVPAYLRPEFENIWSSFILPIETNVLGQNDKSFLLNHLERFNIDWNSFHKNITKGNYNLPRSQVKVSDIMHNRWNQILKIVLRR
jgi:hypothetical protein